jgi:hypothetical protein
MATADTKTAASTTEVEAGASLNSDAVRQAWNTPSVRCLPASAAEATGNGGVDAVTPS